MDSYVELLYKAQENNKNATNKEVRCYNTAFTPPKKVERSKVSSANVRKFLARKEEEDKKRMAEALKKKEELLALRSQDKKAQKRVQVMLKRTKSANKSVMEDAIDNVNTADTLAGFSKQCDEDDYGYVSQEASAFYNKLINKYENMPAEDTPFSKMKREVKDLSAAKDRVRAALQKEAEEELLPHKRKRKKHEDGSEEKYSKEDSEKNDSREQDEQNLEQENEKISEQKKKRKPLPPPIKFDQLLQLAEKKQHEPIMIVEKPKEPDRLMTKKEKSEFFREEERRLNKSKRRSTYLIPENSSEENNSKKNSISDTKSKATSNKPEELKKCTKIVESSLVTNGESKKHQSEFSNKDKLNKQVSGSILIDRLKKDSSVWGKNLNQNPVNQIQSKEKSFKIHKKTDVTSKKTDIAQKRPEKVAFKPPEKESNDIDASLSDIDREIELLRKKRMLLASKAMNENSQTNRGPPTKGSGENVISKPKKSEEAIHKRPDVHLNQKQKKPMEESIQRKRPEENSIQRKRPDENSIQRKRPEENSIQRQKRPDDLINRQRRPNLDSIQRPKKPMKSNLEKKKLKKRRIDSDSEYDSELDDFIDDDDNGGDDYSKYISEIFGYDKSKYAAVEDDDECMESNFAQQMKEEYVSTKIGILEDLEDIRKEQEEKKRKAKMKLMTQKKKYHK